MVLMVVGAPAEATSIHLIGKDFSTHLAGASIFLKMDVVRGYYLVLVHQQNIPKTAVISMFRLFKFLRMRFGLKGVTQTFHQLMDMVLWGMPSLFLYLDDILVASASPEEHLLPVTAKFGLWTWSLESISSLPWMCTSSNHGRPHHQIA